MNKMKFADIFFLFLGLIGILFGGKFGTKGYIGSALCIILSAIIFATDRKKKESL